MTNPLVAQREDSTESFSGVPILESVNDTQKAIESGDWAAGVMGAVGTGLDALGMALDPFGSILAAGVGWLMEHVGPLSDALDSLTGDPDEIKAHSETWKNVSAELGEINAEMTRLVRADTAQWVGAAGDAYRARSEDTNTLITAAQKAADGAASGIGTAGEVVAAVRTLVRDIIAELVGHLISWALQVLATLGIAMAWVVPQVVAEVAKVAARIADITTKLIKAMKSLAPLLKKLGDGFGDAKKALADIKADGGKSSGSQPPPKGPAKEDGPASTSSQGADTPPPKSPPPGNGPASTSSQGADTPPPPPSPPPGNNTPPPTDRSPDGGPAPTSSSSAPPPSGKPNPPPTRSSNKPNDPADRKTPAENICTGGSEPVDMATGHVVMTEIDLEIPGPLSVVLERMYVSSYRAGRWFGHSWSSTLDQRLEIDDENVCYFSPDGMILVFPLPSADSPVLPIEGPRWPLALREDGGYRLEIPHRGQVLDFGRRGKGDPVLPLLAIVDDEGRRIDFEHRRFGPPKAIRHSDGYRVEIDSAQERVAAIRVVDPEHDVNVPVMRYGYDARGRLSEVINSSGKALVFRYDEADRLTEWQDRNGFWFRYLYDETGRCVRTEGDRGFFDSTFTYEGSTTKYADSLGGVKEFEFNEAKQLVRETDALGNTTLSTWDRYDRLQSRTDPLGRTTHYQYDEAGRPVLIARPDGSTARLRLDAGGNAVSITVSDGERTWRRSYEEGLDPFGGKIGTAPELSLDELRSQSGVAPAQAEAEESDPRLLDLFGRRREVATPGGGRIQVGWTVEGQRSWQVDSTGARRQWRYDPEGNEIARVDPLGGVRATEYGPFETELVSADETGARTTRTFDTERRLTSITNPQGLTWHYVRDLAGRVIEEHDFDGRVLRYTYDAAGQLIRSVDGAGEVTEYVYDVLGNLVEWRAPSDVTAYTYSPVGHLVRATNGDSIVEFERDDEERITAETVNGRSVTFDYDDVNGTVRRRTPSGVASSWTWDQDGRAVSLAFQGHSLNFEYDSGGQPVSRSVDGAAALLQAYDSEQRLTSQTLVGGSRQAVLQRRFHYRPDGELIGTDDGLSGSIRYQIDPSGRVLEVIAPDRRESYRYDGAGNIVAANGVPGVEAGPRRHAGNSLVEAGAVHYQHDARGRLVQRADRTGRNWRYAWDSYDRLVAVVTPGGAVWRYRYDPLGRRLAKQRLAPDSSAVVEQVEFVWEGATLIEQLHTDARGRRTITTWAHHPDGDAPVAQLERDERGQERFHSIVTDQVGTPTDLFDPRGTITWHGRKSLWGEELASRPSAATTPLRFPGQYADLETGLHYNVYRYYDPATGRYLSQDPLGLAPAPNPAAYVLNPHSAADPLGLTGTKRRCQGTGPSGQPPVTGNGGQNAGALGDGAAKRPKTHVDPSSGRSETQGGGTTSVGPKEFKDGRPQYGSGPKDGECTDVEDLNANSEIRSHPGGGGENNLSQDLVDKLDGAGLRADEKWIKGHLQNDNLGGQGVSENLTPMTSYANGRMHDMFEGPVKNGVDAVPALRQTVPPEQALIKSGWTPQEARDIHDGIKDLRVSYEVKTSDTVSFRNSPNNFEHSIRDYVELNAKYEGGNDALREYLEVNKKQLPELPVPGTRMDPVTGKFSSPLDGYANWHARPPAQGL